MMTAAEQARNREIAAANIVQLGEGRWLVPSATTVGVHYLVVRTESGSLSCMCDGAIHGSYCWHLTAVARREMQDKVNAERAAITAETRRAATNLLLAPRHHR